ncbi:MULTISPECIES: hypothetical protein [Bacillus cereus group]|uniref:hypothetical protein n=1 Tax=Bacillus cereus group TaxID=86661 RepID=UPI0005AEF846|nr:MULTISPECIES: hypothetical protein [Bacillus cereus group]KIP26348.1 hypothetical protein BG10_6707 [Bacillus thuringiensis serovar morrisoni]MCT6948277.1 hypothetical protein [Bacillus thuringiensis]MED2080200.1 hypothetical protein [Bacillus thuringiensis]MEE2015566.1 hypothetical protein [Bacillus thuringiensis]NUW49300.1 hypothetical protein [Bacillus thuringiensis]
MDKEKDFKQLQHTYNVYIYEDTLSEFDMIKIMMAYCEKYNEDIARIESILYFNLPTYTEYKKCESNEGI